MIHKQDSTSANANTVAGFILNLKTKQVIAGKLAGPGRYVSRKQSINKNVGIN